MMSLYALISFLASYCPVAAFMLTLTFKGMLCNCELSSTIKTLTA